MLVTKRNLSRQAALQQNGTSGSEAMTPELTKEFISFYPSLVSFIYRLTCNRQEAEDIAQDTFLSAAKNVQNYRRESSFKTWVFAIAINKAKNNKKVKKRWQVDYQDKGEALHLTNRELLDKLISKHRSVPDVDFEIKEHINYCFNCVTKTLDLSQQVCLWLKEFYGFKVSEIMEATGMTEGAVKHGLTYARQHMSEVFENRCAFINKKGTCHQCTSLKGIVNPKQNALAEANKIKRNGTTTANKTLLDVRIRLIKDINPLEANNSHLHTYMLEKLPSWASKKDRK
jgi:RNA polymerase sigma-70 factor, ECF subfamily